MVKRTWTLFFHDFSLFFNQKWLKIFQPTADVSESYWALKCTISVSAQFVMMSDGGWVEAGRQVWI